MLAYDEYCCVDPRRISRVVDAARVGAAVPRTELEPALVRGGDWDRPAPDPFPETRGFLRIREILRDRATASASAVPHGHGERARILSLANEIRAHGYRTQTELGTGHPADEVRLAIDRSGRPMLIGGARRLAIARLLGCDRIPARIALRHRSWVDFQHEIVRYGQRWEDGLIYQRIPHPDLAFIEARYGEGRVRLLAEALAEHDCTGRELVDIGSHWGILCHAFEDLGFACTAIEKRSGCLYYLRKIHAACDRRFDIFEGSVFRHPDLGRFDVVVALNVFHHFLKTETNYKRLLRLLDALHPEVLLFQAHCPDPPGQMAGAYRNPGGDEFAAFVAEHAGLPHRRKLGETRDGRPLYKIWR